MKTGSRRLHGIATSLKLNFTFTVSNSPADAPARRRLVVRFQRRVVPLEADRIVAPVRPAAAGLRRAVGQSSVGRRRKRLISSVTTFQLRVALLGPRVRTMST
jgi:hypothetical protein